VGVADTQLLYPPPDDAITAGVQLRIHQKPLRHYSEPGSGNQIGAGVMEIDAIGFRTRTEHAPVEVVERTVRRDNRRAGLLVQIHKRFDVLGLVPVVTVEPCDRIEALDDRGNRSDGPRRVAHIVMRHRKIEYLDAIGVLDSAVGAVVDDDVRARVGLISDTVETLLKPFTRLPVVGSDNRNSHATSFTRPRARLTNSGHHAHPGRLAAQVTLCGHTHLL